MARVDAFQNLLRQARHFSQVLLKVKILDIGEGKCKAELKLCEEHTNHMGGLHGGLSATLVDVISSYALSTHTNCKGARMVSVDLHCSYLKGAKLGDEIVIDANTLRVGKTLAYLEVDIRNKDTGDLLVKGAHTEFLFRP